MSRTSIPLAGLAAVAVAAAFALTVACGDDDDDAGTTVEVALSEWKISANPAGASPGQIRFRATNAGTIDHELVIIRTDTAPSALPMSPTERKADEKRAGETIGEIEEFGKGKAKSKTFALQAGKYALICNIGGHYEQGMSAGFEVR